MLYSTVEAGRATLRTAGADVCIQNDGLERLTGSPVTPFEALNEPSAF